MYLMIGIERDQAQRQAPRSLTSRIWTPGRVVHRAALLHELLSPLPADIMSTSKKLVDFTPIDATYRIALPGR